MHARQEPGPELLQLAAAQAGVLTTRQAELLGVGRHARHRLVQSGRWERVAGRVYAVHGLPLDWTGQAWAGVLLGGDGARLGGVAAGYLHGLVLEPPAAFTVLTSVPVPDRAPWEFRRDVRAVRSSRAVGEPPRTDIDDTVLDLCEHADADEILTLVAQALHLRRTTDRRLLRTLDGRSRHSRRALLGEMLGEVRAGVRSPLELRYRRDVEQAHGLPPGERQHQSARSGNRRDLVYVTFRLVVELDGRLGHQGLGRFRDMRRDNEATLQGEVTLRYGTADVAGSPCAVARQVAAVVTARGWDGLLRRCPRCVGVPVEETV